LAALEMKFQKIAKRRSRWQWVSLNF